MKSSLPAQLARVRRDLSEWVWHFCRRDRDPLTALRAILSSGHVRGGTDPYCTEQAICLTETPIAESARQSSILEKRDYTRISEYGVGFKKSWVFAAGGLPAIYQPAALRDQLPVGMRWRHCELDYHKNLSD